jgi:hypothetical protein
MDTVSLDALQTSPLISDTISIMLGIALSAACGFRIFVPFLVVSLIGVLGGISLPSGFEWLDTQQALILFAVASSIEVLAYYIPWLDNILDTVGTPLAAAAGAFATAAAIPPEMSPLVQWTIAVIAGGGSAGLIKGLTSVSRVASTATTGGLANPLLATVELVAATILAVLAVTLPAIAAIVVLAVLIAAIVKVRQIWLKKKSIPSASS